MDCFRVVASAPVSLADYIEAFYSSPVFRIERGLLGVALGKGASDVDARSLAAGRTQGFAIWSVEGRTETQILLSAGRTRSWLRVDAGPAPGHPATVTLFFGSAVLPGRDADAGPGFPFNALLGFHKLYSRALLASARSRLPSVQARRGEGPNPA